MSNDIAVADRKVTDGDLIEAVHIRIPDGNWAVLDFPQLVLHPGERYPFTALMFGRNFKPHRVLIPDGIADYFYVIDIQIGRKTQFTTPGPIPGWMFSDGIESENSEHKKPMDILHPSMEARVLVENVSSRSRKFACILIGKHEERSIDGGLRT